MSARSDARERWLPRLAPLLPVLAVPVVYGRTLGFDFVWDDFYVSRRPVYATGDVWAVLSAPANVYEYLPVRDLSLLLDHALFGNDPSGFHLTNLVLFGAAAWLVHRLYAQLLAGRAPARPGRAGPRLLALVAASVFVVHPLQAEPVAFVTARNALLALVFSLAALLAYMRHLVAGGRGAWAASLGLTALALLSKATAVCLPLLLALLHLHPAAARTGRSGARALGRLAPHALLALAVTALQLAMAAGTRMEVADAGGPAERIGVAAFVPVFYAVQFLWPVNLTIDYALARHVQPLALAAGLALLFWAGVAELLRYSRGRGLAALCTLAYLAALLPVLNLVPTTPVVADRYAQIPLVWLTPLVVVATLRRLPARAAAAVGLAVVLLLGTLAWRQAGLWRDNPTLFAHAVEARPDSVRLLANLGMTLWDAGQRDPAIDLFREIARVDPDDFHFAFARGWRALDRGRLREAETLLREATRKSGRTVFLADMKLAELELRRGRRAAALEAYRRAARRVPDDPAFDGPRAEIQRALETLGGGRGARGRSGPG